MAMNRRTTTAKPAAKTTPAKPAATAAKGKDDKGPDKGGFLAAAKNGAKQWQESRKIEPQERASFNDNLPAGTYYAQIVSTWYGTQDYKAEGSRVTAKVPAVRLILKITDGDHTGELTSFSPMLSNEVGWNILSEALQRLGYDTKDKSFEKMETIVATLEQIAEKKPHVKIGVKRTPIAPAKQKNGKTHYINVYINELLEDTPEGEETETTETEEETNEEAVEVSEGMLCTYNGKEGWTISKVIEDEGEITLNLKDAKGKKASGIAVDECSDFMEPAND